MTTRILHIVGNMAPDGMSNFLMNIYRNIDREKLQFDFIVMGEKPDNYHEVIRQMGGRVYKVTRMSKNPVAYYQEIRDIIHENQYKVVFRQTDTATVAIDLLAAKAGGAVVRIPHSHSTRAVHPFFHKLMQPILIAASTDRYACGRMAGDFMFGKAGYTVVYNGIDLKQFVFQPDVRRKMRQEAGLMDTQLAFGHVGNFFYPKNHEFLLQVFREIVKLRQDAKLFLIGSGELQESIEQQIQNLHLTENVVLLGMRKDIPDLLQMLDCMIFPSHYEGLPIALVEAQGTGLPALISDVITDEICITKLVEKKSLKAATGEWAAQALQLAEKGNSSERCTHVEELKAAGYALSDLVSRYEKWIEA